LLKWLPPGLRAAIPFVLLLLCVAAIVGGILLSGTTGPPHQGMGGNNTVTNEAMVPEIPAERGIIVGGQCAALPT
jgi:hypothetical protein